MRKPIIAGNWKMHMTLPESVAFVKELQPQIEQYTDVECVVAPTFLALASVSDVLKNTSLKVSSQQVHWEASGAYTSEVSPTMLKGIVDYAIIGHSECRAYLNETDERVNKKARAALDHGITPIIAVGESLEQNERGETHDFVSNQVREALKDIPADSASSVVIAYEPIWAIGTGKSASGEVAQKIIGDTVRGTLKDLYGESVANQIRIQYGGSVKPDNMQEYMSQPDIDGALVGGASLKVASFVELIRIASIAKG